jgi:hypothetical protein
MRAIPNRIADLIERLYPGWNPDAAWRYLPVARVIRQTLGPEARVLDVGAGGTGIAPYARNPCVLTDIGHPESAAAPFVQGSALALPFKTDSFPCVISADCLEHLPPDSREAAVVELFRVARALVILAVPCGPQAERHDRQLYEASRPDSGLRAFLSEHLDNGLPSEAELVGWVTAAAQKAFRRPVIETQWNTDLRLRYRMMRGIVRSGDWGAIIRVRFWTPLAPLLERVRPRQGYRLVVVCRDEGVREAS